MYLYDPLPFKPLKDTMRCRLDEILSDYRSSAEVEPGFSPHDIVPFPVPDGCQERELALLGRQSAVHQVSRPGKGPVRRARLAIGHGIIWVRDYSKTPKNNHWGKGIDQFNLLPAPDN